MALGMAGAGGKGEGGDPGGGDPGLAEQAWALAFGGLTLDQGIALREGIAHRHFPAPDPARYRGLLSIADLDAFLATEAARSPRVSMADGSRPGSAAVPEEAYTRTDGTVDPARLFARFDAGATLVLSQFHEVHAGLMRFCRGLEQAFLHGVQANIYLTPPGAQGFRVHYDTHDVLVLQVQGEKHWRVWPGQPFPAPTRRTPWASQVQAEGEPVAITLRPGDALYVPRGLMHDAAAQEGGEASLHVTVGLMEPSWAQALRLALEALEETDPAFRAAFPTWRLAGEGPASLAGPASALGARLAAPAALETLALRLLDRLAQDRPALLGRGLFPPKLTPGTRLRLAGGVLHTLVPDARGGASLRWAGGVEALDAREADWLMALEEGATPAGLGDGALEFCERLFRLGLLEMSGGAAP
jgi:hypothetical protein